jgi:hypothetical protein
MGFVPFIFFLVYSLKVKGVQRKRGILIATAFLIISVFCCSFEWPGFLDAYLAIFRLIIAFGIIFLYAAISPFFRKVIS